MAKTLSAADRDEKQKPRELVAAMSLKPGMMVADIGTGTGYMLPYLSEAVGAQGHVLSEDIFPDFLEKAKNTAKQHRLANVEFIKGSETDPGLPAEWRGCGAGARFLSSLELSGQDAGGVASRAARWRHGW